MKKTSLYLLLAVSGVMSACDNSDTDVIIEPTDPLPVRMEMNELTRELIYSTSGDLWKIKNVSHYPGGNLESVSEFTFNASGALTGARIDVENPDVNWRVAYTLEDNRITRTDEYMDEQLVQYLTFTYDGNGKVLESLTWQDVGEGHGVVPISKTTNQYDANGNVTESKIYYYNTGTGQHVLLSKATYSQYDDHLNSEDFFNVQIHNPLIKLFVNNPGKFVIENGNQVVGSTDLYTYEYKNAYAVKKKTHTTLHNGETGSYDTHYYFE